MSETERDWDEVHGKKQRADSRVKVKHVERNDRMHVVPQSHRTCDHCLRETNAQSNKTDYKMYASLTVWTIGAPFLKQNLKIYRKIFYGCLKFVFNSS